MGLYVIFNVVQFLSVPAEKELTSFAGADIAIQCEKTLAGDKLVVTINTSVEKSLTFRLDGCQSASSIKTESNKAKIHDNDLWALEFNGFQKITYARTRAKILIMPFMALFGALPVLLFVQLILVKGTTKNSSGPAKTDA